jgi:hypothetical protein
MQAVVFPSSYWRSAFPVSARLNQTVGVTGSCPSVAFGSLFFQTRFRTPPLPLFRPQLPIRAGSCIPKLPETLPRKKGSLVDFPGLVASSHFSGGKTTCESPSLQ